MKAKKKVLILGGNSNKNISWINNMNELYSIDYEVYIIQYDNWYNNEEINLDKEINKIIEIITNKNIDIIIAKSIGILLTILATKRNIVVPKTIIFMGYPLKVLDETKIDILNDLLELNKKTNMLIIQQDKDCLCYSDKLEKLLNKKVPLITIKGHDHSYDEIYLIKEHIDKFINKK